MTKPELRAHLTARLREARRDEGRQRLASERICHCVREHSGWAGASLVAAFLPLPSEPQIAPLWEEERARRYCFPRIRDGQVELITVTDAEVLRRADWKFDHAALAAAPVLDPLEVQLFLVPGLAFTAHGARLGRGGGFYDRLLARRSASSIAIGVCFHLQVVPALPGEPHDQRVDAVITEEGLARP